MAGSVFEYAQGDRCILPVEFPYDWEQVEVAA
jgi:hypothetical protein